MADLSKLSDDDLIALRSGDLSKVSDAGLMALKGAPAPNKAKEFGKQFGSPTERGVISSLQGPTFGFIDEIMGGMGGVTGMLQGKPFGESYRETRDVVRGMNEKYKEDFPIGAPATQMMTSMATAPLFKAKAAAGVVPATWQAMRTGAASGALAGAGESQAEDVSGVGIDALKGGAAGGALGGAGNVAATVLGAGGRNVMQRAAPMADKIPVLLGGTGSTGANWLRGQAEKGAQAKIVEALVRDSQVPGSAVGQAVARKNTLGPEARIVDTGGQNTRQLLDTMATLPGQSKQATERAIRERQAGRAGRLIESAESSLGTNGDRAAQVVSELVRTRQAAATPLYGHLHRMEVQATPELAGILNAAEQLGAGKVARDISTAAQLPYSLSQQEWASSGGRLSMRDLDHMKQGLDTLIAKQTDLTGKVSPLGYRLQGLRERMLGELDIATQGFYRRARDAFAGPSALIDATNTGRRFMTADDSATRQVMGGLSTSEQEAFRLGAFEALRNKLGRPGGQTEVMNMWKDRILREKLQVIFPDERSFRQFAATASAEANMKGLEGVGRGSQTASRLYGVGDMDMSPLTDAASMAASASHGNVAGMLGSGLNLMRSVKTPEPVRDRMGALLLSRDTNELRALAPLLERINAARANSAASVGLLGGQAGSAAANTLFSGR